MKIMTINIMRRKIRNLKEIIKNQFNNLKKKIKNPTNIDIHNTIN